jgi:protein phosphatase
MDLLKSMSSMRTEAYGKTDVGRVRKNNEDQFLMDLDLGLFIVADGMGGHNAGEVASKMAVDVVRDSVRRFANGSQKAILGKVDSRYSERTNQLGSSVRLSNQFIRESARATPQHNGMGTTVDCIWVQKDKLSIAHVGDSRVYLVREGQLHLLTNDHSLVEEQVRQGLLKKEEAERSPLKHILTRALGVDENVEVDLSEVPFYDGDLVIGCTDGLMKTVPDADILKTAREMKTPKMIVEHLIDLGNVAGGVDNITVVAVQFSK